MSTQIVLGALISPAGTAKASWRHPDVDPAMVTSVEAYIELAKTAERGFFDLFFLADTPGARYEDIDQWSRDPLYHNALEPMTLLSALAVATEHIGLGGTLSSTFFEPFNIARQFASLDHISHGRAAWNVVTSALDINAQNFGQDAMPPHHQRYARAREVLEIVKSYWDTWEDDAFVFDKEAGRNFDPQKFHIVDHEGEFFRVKGALNTARPPQGHPVIVQAGASETGRDLAAETADVVFGVGSTLEAAKAFTQDVKGRTVRFGRTPDDLLVLTGVNVIVGPTRAEALARAQVLEDCVPIGVRVHFLATDLETKLGDLPLDEPIPEERIPASTNQLTYYEEILQLHRQALTLRQVAEQYNRTKAVIVGDPVEVADQLEAWIKADACDGFMFTVPWLPGGLEDLVDHLVPELQRRGLVRTENQRATLRERLGLTRPHNRHAQVLG